MMNKENSIMNNKQIYVLLKGRIGNQLFIYAFVRNIQKQLGENTEIIIDDTFVLEQGWENSLTNYDLENVHYVHNKKVLYTPKWIFKFFVLRIVVFLCRYRSDYKKQYAKEKKYKRFLEILGILNCENGYLDFNINKNKSILVNGYFQSEKYFPLVKDELKKTFSLSDNLVYPHLDVLDSTNSVCISVKVEHNVGSSLYAVCGKEYWQDAIAYIIQNIKDPVFFVCSDNVEYVKQNLIDCEKFKVIFQDSTQPIHKSLAAMSHCKHFIIGNTTFGWWAQYISNSKDKIMIAPNQWMLVDMPIDIYQDSWILIDVKKYLGDKAL